MYLSRQEEKMLNGGCGEAVRLAMKVLTKFGDTFNCSRMIKITCAHSYGAGMERSFTQFVEKLVALGAHTSVPLTVNPAAVDFERWEEFGIPKELVEEQLRCKNALKQIGGMLWSCAPYHNFFTPRFGEHIAWQESSAIVYANSVLGARTDRYGGDMTVLAAIAGRVPEYGFHIDENRTGNLLVEVNILDKELVDTDYWTIGAIVGKNASGDDVPVLTGIPKTVSKEQLEYVGTAAATWGGVGLFHAVGATPEAQTLDQAFGGSKPTEKLTINRNDIAQMRESIGSYKGRRLDAVVLGCPLYSFREVFRVARLLRGRKISKDLTLLIYTSKYEFELTKDRGLMDAIEGSGAKLVPGVCIAHTPLYPFAHDEVGVFMTDSAKIAYYTSTLQSLHYQKLRTFTRKKIDVIFGSVEECVEAAIRGEIA